MSTFDDEEVGSFRKKHNNPVSEKIPEKSYKGKIILGATIGIILIFSFVVWCCGSSNPSTPAGYVGYLTKGAVFGQTKFYGLQTGPTSPGRTWMLSTTNVSVTPYTYTEEFKDDTAVLSKDNLKINFRVQVVWRVKTNQVKEFVEKYSTLVDEKELEKDANKVVEVAYNNFLHAPLRTFSRDEIQRYDGLKIKDNISGISENIHMKVITLTKDTPFEVMQTVVANIQYPPEVADSVSKKLAATQLLEQKSTEMQIKQKDADMRVIEATGISKAMEIINQRLTQNYLQHEAIEAQKAMVGSPNHTTIYIPVGPNGVPIVKTSEK
jgi:regulator of protease activity HflC (stomatin/prohibitin superfamily)